MSTATIPSPLVAALQADPAAVGSVASKSKAQAKRKTAVAHSNMPSQTASPKSALKVRARPWRAFSSVEDIARWHRLSDDVTEPNPFYESWYLLPSLSQFDPRAQVKLLIFEQDDELVALMPIHYEQNYYSKQIPHWRNWTHANAFLDLPLVKRGYETAFFEGLLNWADARGGLGMFFHLSKFSHGTPLHAALDDVLTQQNRSAATVIEEERALLQSDMTPAEYFEASLSTKKRKELRRQQRRLAELGELRFERRNDNENLASWIDKFLSLEHAGWKGKAGSSLSSDPRTKELFDRVLNGASSHNKLERLTLWLDDKPIAMLASLLSTPAAFSYKTAFNEGYSRFSPGVLLQQENLAMLENSAIEWCDSCASANHPMIDHFWREKRKIVSHSIAIGGKPRRALFNLLSRFENGSAPRGIS